MKFHKVIKSNVFSFPYVFIVKTSFQQLGLMITLKFISNNQLGEQPGGGLVPERVSHTISHENIQHINRDVIVII